MEGVRARAWLGAAAVVAVGLFGPGSGIAAASTGIHVVAHKIQNPRGLEVAPNGRSLYVAAAGKAGHKCVNVPGKGQQCTGTSGSIMQIGLVAHERKKIVKGLPSFGPKDGTFVSGVSDVSLAPSGDLYSIETVAPSYQVQQLPKDVQHLNGTLFRVDGKKAKPVADIGAYESANDPDGYGLSSSPAALDASLSGAQYVADSAANDILSFKQSALSLLSVLLGPGSAASEPTAITRGPDGGIYIGESGPGGGRVVEILAGIERVYATGFTEISGLDFGAAGTLYVTEKTTSTLTPNSRGAIIELMPLGIGRCAVADSTGLRLPAGGVVSPDGETIYVSNNSTAPSSTPKGSAFNGDGGEIVSLAAHPLCH